MCGKAATHWPKNYIYAVLFTVSSSYIFADICAGFNYMAVCEAFFMTCGVSLAVTFYAWRTKIDFTFYAPLPFVLGFILVVAAILFLVFADKLINIIYAIFFAIFFACYLLLDTILIVK